jgi:hypothetical protein
MQEDNVNPKRLEALVIIFLLSTGTVNLSLLYVYWGDTPFLDPDIHLWGWIHAATGVSKFIFVYFLKSGRIEYRRFSLFAVSALFGLAGCHALIRTITSARIVWIKGYTGASQLFFPGTLDWLKAGVLTGLFFACLVLIRKGGFRDSSA